MPTSEGSSTILDTERGLLGAVLEDNSVWEHVAMLRSGDFSLDANRRIFAAMVYLRESGSPIDMLALSKCLDLRNELEAIGGVAYLSSLIDGAVPLPTCGSSCQHHPRGRQAQELH